MSAPVHMAVWCEFLPYPDVIPLLPELARRGLGLHLAVQAGRAGEPALFDLLARARDLGVEVRAWVLLAPEEGYWPNAWNAGHWAELALAFADRAALRGTPPAWVIADLEPPPERISALAGALAARRWREAWRLAADLPAAGGAGDGAALRGAIANLQARGIRVQAVTLPLALDGPFADRLLAGLGVDFLALPWDEVSFMAYRPEFARLAGPLGADLVGSYAADAVARFGPRASLAIGEVGSPGFPAPVAGYTDPAELQADLAACRAARLPAISIFSLDGLLQQGGLARWLDAAPAAAPRPSPRSALVRLAVATACLLLPDPDRRE
ncbi:MAG: hypothetical protein FJZ01_19970 [Candidatus Sericytochromatia bacterium]|nr:hypothetical protein [Candidatus Tanganyikabacteria bacterium]